jgi:RNA polymerase sigma-70 factor (ECF subfamily)
MSEGSSTQLQAMIARLQAGDAAARDELIGRAYDRLRRLTAKMLRAYPVVQDQESTGDVLHDAFPRLRRALDAVPPASVADFFRLAALQIRRELTDMARGYRRRPAAGALPGGAATDSADAAPAPPESTYDPVALERWREFHEQVEHLPEEERAVFDLLYYHDLTQDETALALGVSVPTIKRRWTAARLRLSERLSDGRI